MTRDEFMQRWGGWFTGPMGGHPGGARGQFRDDLASLVKAEVEAFSAVERQQAREESAQLATRVINWHRERGEADLRGVLFAVVNAIRSGAFEPEGEGEA